MMYKKRKSQIIAEREASKNGQKEPEVGSGVEDLPSSRDVSEMDCNQAMIERSKDEYDVSTVPSPTSKYTSNKAGGTTDLCLCLKAAVIQKSIKIGISNNFWCFHEMILCEN